MIISVVIGFFRESLGLIFVMDIFLNFVLTIAMWSFGNLVDGSKEYLFKLASWNLFIYTLTMSLSRIAFNQLLIPLAAGILGLVITNGTTYALWRWFQNEGVFREEDHRLTLRATLVLGVYTTSQFAAITLAG